MRTALAGLALAAGLAATPVPAQEVATAPAGEPAPVLVLRQDELFAASAFGQAAAARQDAAARALLAENRQIEAALEAEERDLTERRPSLPPEEFRRLADAFDDKVEAIRTAQDAKGRAIARLRDDDRTRFLQAAVPVLAEIMAEYGASVILDQAVVVLSYDRVDITGIAIARIDARIGAGDLPDAAPEGPLPDPAPDPAPQPAPAPVP
ncbi:MAG TPA: OmpH family outer membrane protein [Paracoccaceae bacterium]|nr:OmpH family outer membrane protein [Paracoccaceae bacterium]HMO72392.1 OmpH family outer membrane protein [Paracoccaceae bacterium]